MKKIFLIVAIAAFASASAQKNDIFDIQKYLEKKTSKEKDEIINFYPKLSIPGDQTNNQTVWMLENGNTVSILPQDHMPCVIPDMGQFNMPVVKPDMSQFTIPNPAYPPQSKTNPFQDRLKELLDQQKSSR